MIGPDASPAELDAAADDAATHAFVNCWLRESPGWRVVPAPRATGPAAEVVAAAGDCTHVVVAPLAGRGVEVLLGVRHLSPALRHRFALPARLSVQGGPASPVGFVALVALVLDELAHDDPRGPGDTAGLVARILDSRDEQRDAFAARAADLARLWGPDPLPFIDTEQALLVGHQIHPTPKSRTEMSPLDRRRYAPERQGRFALRWLAVERGLVRQRSATGTPAAEMAERLLGPDAAALRARATVFGAAPDAVLVPVHPWELEHLRDGEGLGGLVATGAAIDLGPAGAPVTATSSVRTVWQEGWPWQLKCSMHLSVTNSVRVTLPKELDRAVESALLARTEVGEAAAKVAPDFVMVQDPAYLAVADPTDPAGRALVDGLSVLFRENRWPGGSPLDATCVATLCQDRPGGGPSRAGALVAALAARHGEPPHEVGRRWFARFCDVAVRSIVRLYLDLGLTFEPHQQNTLLELEGGWPVRCAYRDSQGYFHREAAHADLCRVIPGLGEESESIFPEALADERLVYYPFLNLALGVVNALGVAGVADEDVLLGDLRDLLAAERAAGGRYPATLLDRLLDDDRWPCKGNLRTRVHAMDELVGDIATQSIYVTVPNPLRPAVRA
ncbi:MAG: IucA/IucC family siderophore biosynthesis protein [Acidimicrobiia bacterium]